MRQPDELRLAVRAFRRSPLFSVSVVLTFALVIGANTAIFSLVDAMLFRPLPLHATGQLLRLDAHSSAADAPSPYPWSYRDFTDYRNATKAVFSDVSLFAHGGFNFRHNDELKNARAAIVSANFFETMGLQPLLGRTLKPALDSSTNATHVVISKSFWQKEFHSDPAIVGKPITLNKRPFMIVGVVDGGSVFRAFGAPQMFVPVHAASAIESGNSLSARGARWIGAVYARLHPGASIVEARKLLNVESSRLAREYPNDDAKLGLQISVTKINNFADLLSHDHGTTARITEFLWIAVILILAIACANILNLFLVRGAGRLREIAVRSVLGASRLRLVRQLLTESGLLCVTGGILGVLIGFGALVYARRFPAIDELHPTLDWRIVGYAALLTVGAALLFGLVPLIATKGRDLARHLGAVQPTPGKRQRRLRRVLSIGQIALAMALLVATGLMLHTLIVLQNVDLGFNPHHLLVAELDFHGITGKFYEPPSETTLDALRKKLTALPGVSAASYADRTPLDGISLRTHITPTVGPVSHGAKPWAEFATVGAGYFQALDADIRRGTGFTTILSKRRNAVIINEAMAQRYWRGQNPIGQSFHAGQAVLRIVGVVSGIRGGSPTEAPKPFFYRRYPSGAGAFVEMVIRTSRTPTADLKKVIAQTIRDAAPGLPAFKIKSMHSRLQGMLAPRTSILWALGVFGCLALLITAVGIFAVVAYNVTLRYREFALRMVVGARPGNIRRLIVREVLGLAAIGILIGFLLSLLAGHLLEHYLFGISSLDPTSIGGVIVLLLAIALLAAAAPVWRASRLQPARVLHDQ